MQVCENIGKLILRLSVGVLLLPHGIYKILNGVDDVSGLVGGLGFPHFLVYGVYIGEVLAPIMLILGFRVKIASILVIITMLVAIFSLNHISGGIFNIGKLGGWSYELQGLYLLGALAIFFLGSGRFALDIKKCN